jgi:hypothetical protein
MPGLEKVFFIIYLFQAIELFRGRIRVSYDVGNYPVSTMFSYELLADGHYHTVELLAVKKNFTLRVDNGLARQDFSFRIIHRPVLKTKLCSGTGNA